MRPTERCEKCQRIYVPLDDDDEVRVAAYKAFTDYDRRTFDEVPNGEKVLDFMDEMLAQLKRAPICGDCLVNIPLNLQATRDVFRQVGAPDAATLPLALRAHVEAAEKNVSIEQATGELMAQVVTEFIEIMSEEAKR